MTIPLIDLGDRQAANLIARAGEDTGFLVVTNHGVDHVLLDAAWAAATRFFDLPVADKMAVAMPYPGYPYGYAPMRGERLAASLGDDTPPDLKETFSMGPIEGPARPPADPAEAFVYEPTPWPPALPELQPVLEAYYSAMSGLVARLMRLFADALQLPRNFFDSRIDRHTSALRLLNYPPLSESPEPGQLRAGAHTDYGTVTVLHAEAPQGLEVAGAFADWRSVDGRAGSYRVVDCQPRRRDGAMDERSLALDVAPSGGTGCRDHYDAT